MTISKGSAKTSVVQRWICRSNFLFIEKLARNLMKMNDCVPTLKLKLSKVAGDHAAPWGMLPNGS